jgi:hypothetical protein
LIFAILFIIAFLFGFVSFALTREWIIAVSIPTVLFIISTLVGESAPGAKTFTLTFGVPLVFVAGLLGAYIYQIRNLEVDDSAQSESDELDNRD